MFLFFVALVFLFFLHFNLASVKYWVESYQGHCWWNHMMSELARSCHRAILGSLQGSVLASPGLKVAPGARLPLANLQSEWTSPYAKAPEKADTAAPLRRTKQEPLQRVPRAAELRGPRPGSTLRPIRPASGRRKRGGGGGWGGCREKRSIANPKTRGPNSQTYHSLHMT